MHAYLIFDFDSTFVSVEGLDELARIVLREAPDRAERLARVEEITRDGMEGKIGFGTSLSKRLALFAPGDEDIAETVELLKTRVTPSFVAGRRVLAEEAERIYIISGGFREFIVPVVREFGIAPEHVLANTFVRDADGAVTGCDMSNFCAQDGGKVKALQALGLDGRVVMVGDGYSDYQARAAGAADLFVAFAENMERPAVIEQADAVARSLDEVLEAAGLDDIVSRQIPRV